MTDEQNRRAQPEPQAFPPITEQQSQWGRLYTAANALVVQMGYHGSMQADSIEMESLKDKLHDIDGGEWMPGLMPTAQPEPMRTYGSEHKVFLEDAAPSVAPEPVAWRYQDARGHYRYRAYKPGFDVEYAILKPVPLYAAHPPRAPLTDAEIDDVLSIAYAQLVADGYTGGMGSTQWDHAAARAIEARISAAAIGAAK